MGRPLRRSAAPSVFLGAHAVHGPSPETHFASSIPCHVPPPDSAVLESEPRGGVLIVFPSGGRPPAHHLSEFPEHEHLPIAEVRGPP